MKTLTILFAAVLSMMAFAQVNAGERTFGDGMLPEFLQVYDTDGDGVLSEEERQVMNDARQERREEWIAQWDKNGDGVISEEEKVAAQEQLRQRIEEKRTERFNEADADHDGALSLQEFVAIRAVARLGEQDADKPAMIFARLDADSDGKVSLKEFTRHLSLRREHTGAAE